MQVLISCFRIKQEKKGSASPTFFFFFFFGGGVGDKGELSFLEQSEAQDRMEAVRG